MLKKIIAIVIVYLFLGTMISCFNCPEVPYPYYDFKSISFQYKNGIIVSNQPFLLSIIESDIENVAQVNINIFSTSYAIEKCREDGGLGRKYYITSILVKSNNDWDSKHPAGSLLNDIVLYETATKRNGEITGATYSSNLSEIEFFPNDFGSLNLKFPKPSLIDNHIFTIEIVKSNADSLEATTEHIFWE